MAKPTKRPRRWAPFFCGLVAAAAIILAHNHPSKDVSPSPQDVRLTREICKAGTLLGIELLDHLIIGDGRWLSLKERSLGFD